MNNSKMWLVVNPTVGVPIFLGAVAVGSFAVHVAVLSNTSWVDDFLQGNEMGSSESAALELQGETLNASFVEGTENGTSLVTLPDGTMAHPVPTPHQSAAPVVK